MILRVLFAIVVVAIQPHQTLEPSNHSWEYTQQPDPLHQTVLHKFTLLGKYLTAPRHSSLSNPGLVIVCANGSVQSSYVAAGAVIDTRVNGGTVWINGEVQVDGKNRMFIFDSASTDGTAAFFGRKELKGLLLGKQVLVGLDEFLGSQMVMQFDIPDSGQLETACGQDKSIRDVFKQVARGRSAPSPEPVTKEDLEKFKANSEAGKSSPAAAAAMAVDGKQSSSQDLAELVKQGKASRCAVVTTPAGAEVFIDGNKGGISPLAFVLIKRESPRVITIKMEGYKTVERQIVPDGKIVPIAIQLEKQL